MQLLFFRESDNTGVFNFDELLEDVLIYFVIN